MKKRFVCALLALVLLVGMVPVTASAADHKSSASAITVLKQLATFRNTCYYVSGSEYRTGYGTVCAEKHHFDNTGRPKAGNEHKITESKADAALRTRLTELDKLVNDFASKNGLSLSQSQHDALVIYSHLSGTAWLNGTGVLKSAVINKAGTNEMLGVMEKLSATGAEFERNQVILNMYLNGVYSNSVPTRYKCVTYDLNAPDGVTGKLAVGDSDTYTVYFDATKSVSHITATCPGYTFLGWYTEPAGGQRMPKLDKYCADKTINPDGILYAYWQADSSEGTSTEYPMLDTDLVSNKVYVRAEDGSEAAKTSSGKDATVSGRIFITRDCLDSKGYRWGYVEYETGKFGWVKIGLDKPESLGDEVIATATVTYNGYLNVRKGAGTDYRIVGALAKDDTVKLFEIKTVNGHRWGRYVGGWICLTYTSVNMAAGSNVKDTGAAAYAFSGRVTADVIPYVAAGDYSEEYVMTDAAGEDYFVIPEGTAITISTLTVAPFGGDNATWAKVHWRNKELDKNRKAISTARTGWIPIAGEGTILGSEIDYDVTLDTVDYTVVAETTNVRQNAGDAAQLAFTLNKGVEVEVDKVRLVGENIWGSITVTRAEDSMLDKTGWINLASKYVKRSTDVKLEEETKQDGDHDTGLIATVTGTDNVRVRKTGGLYGAVIGSLSRGTTARVWENKNKEWYKLDTNKNGVYDYKEDGWVSAKYLNVREGTLNDANKVTDASGNTVTTDGTGTGVVANTSAGVNVRQGPGIGYTPVGKLLSGTEVQILEVKQGGAAKWGRIDKGWVCMDYISMVKYNAAPTPEDPSKGTAVDSLDKLEKTTTTAIYTGRISDSACDIMREPIDFSRQDLTNPDVMAQYEANLVRTADAGSNVTIHELATVTQKVKSDKEDLGDGNKTSTTVTTTSYWARVNDGWIQDPENNLELTALDEKVHTLTGNDTLKVREGYSEVDADPSGNVIDKLEKGDQVKVTALDIIDDKVWGRIETEDGTGWIRMDYMTEGAYYVNKPAENTPAASEPVMGSTGNTGTGGYVTNAGGYKYKGKVINTNALRVRASASTSAGVTTTLKGAASLVIYETTISENMAWGRCDAGWVYLYYVDLEPCIAGAVDARVVYNDNTVAYSDVNCTTATGTYARMSVVDIYEIVGKMAKTDLGWVNVDNLL